jgi:F-type H+-transporting ATPase subunit b
VLSRLPKTIFTRLFTLLLFAAICPSSFAHAQESSRPAATPSAQATGHEPAPASSQEKDKKAPMDENAGEPDSLRRSPAVLWLARKTGMTPNQAYWTAVGVNFAVVFFLIALLITKKLPGYFTGRTTAIQKGIEEARKMSEEARSRLSEVEGRLSRLDAEIGAMRTEAEENARAEERRIESAGEEERRRIVSSAEQEISMAANAARRDLKAYAAELAIDLAEKKIRVDQHADEALVREFTARLGKDGQ